MQFIQEFSIGYRLFYLKFKKSNYSFLNKNTCFNKIFSTCVLSVMSYVNEFSVNIDNGR